MGSKIKEINPKIINRIVCDAQIIIPMAFPIANAFGVLSFITKLTTNPTNKGNVPIPPLVNIIPNEPAINPSKIPLIGKSFVSSNE